MSTKGDDNKCHPMRYLFLRYTAAGQFNLYPFIKLISKIMLLACLFTLWSSCEPLVTEFEDIENGQMYKSSSTGATPAQVSKIKIMTWNIRFGDCRIPWFGDSCGDRVLLSEREVLTNLESVAGVINEIKPDILMINEITVDAKLTAYIDQVQWLLDHTYFNYASYASNWKTQFIPSDGLGRMDMGNAIFSRWEISDSKRISLSQRGDQDALTTYFYLRWNILKTKIEVPDLDNFYVLSTHLAAFSTDDTKKKQVTEVMDELLQLNTEGTNFIIGGDFNLLPPVATKTDYCLEDKCPDEHFHGPNDDPQHKEGSNYTPEITWMQPLYDSFEPAISLHKYSLNEQSYFTHSTDPARFWDRKLDYLFTNKHWVIESDVTHQNVNVSDHVPISADWEVPQ